MKGLEKLRNIGPASWRMLRRVGIEDVGTLRKTGAATAFALVRAGGETPSLNLAYALWAGLRGRDWRDISREEKARIQREIADMEELISSGGGITGTGNTTTEN